MRPTLRLLILWLASAAAHAHGFDIAITVDDVPAHGPLPKGMTRLGIALSHLATFKRHGVPEAYGFVNAVKLEREPGSDAVLDAWRAAGYPLANHAYSHMSLTQAASLDAWRADVLRGEPAVASRMAGANWHYFRFPNLAVSGAWREPALAFLQERGYQVADVSVAFGDWVYTDAYARCVARDDQDSIAAMKRQYLQGVERSIAAMQANAQQVFGRIIPHVLLTHLGGWSAVTLPDVMARLDAAGARYISLRQAQSDPAYAQPGGGSLIARVAQQQGIALAVPEASPEPGLDIKSLCR